MTTPNEAGKEGEKIIQSYLADFYHIDFKNQVKFTIEEDDDFTKDFIVDMVGYRSHSSTKVLFVEVANFINQPSEADLYDKNCKDHEKMIAIARSNKCVDVVCLFVGIAPNNENLEEVAYKIESGKWKTNSWEEKLANHYSKVFCNGIQCYSIILFNQKTRRNEFISKLDRKNILHEYMRDIDNEKLTTKPSTDNMFKDNNNESISENQNTEEDTTSELVSEFYERTDIPNTIDEFEKLKRSAVEKYPYLNHEFKTRKNGTIVKKIDFLLAGILRKGEKDSHFLYTKFKENLLYKTSLSIWCHVKKEEAKKNIYSVLNDTNKPEMHISYFYDRIREIK